METTHMSFNWQMDKLQYPYNGIWLSDKKEQCMQEHRKIFSQKTIYCVNSFMTIWKRENYRAGRDLGEL
jgi:hypothetical protein